MHTGGLGSAGVLPDSVLERFIKQYIDSQDAPTIFFGWQGGEPTLDGLEFYRRVVAYQKKHMANQSGIVVLSALQTNGVLLDDQWLSLSMSLGVDYEPLLGLAADGSPVAGGA